MQFDKLNLTFGTQIRPNEGDFHFMKSVEEHISLFAKETAENFGFLIIDIVFRGEKGSKVIQVFIDGENPVTAEVCAEISRELAGKIEQNELMKSAYRLEVSSPGIDKPLKYLVQFKKHINRTFEITYSLNNESNKLIGKLLRMEGEKLFFLPKKSKEEMTLDFITILEAKVIISFS